MADYSYDTLKNLVNLYTIPAAVMQVHKNPDGSCGDVIMFAINKVLEDNYKALFLNDGEVRKVEGQPYYANMPKEPKFEDICFKCAWKGEPVHTYVDTTKMYGFWTEDILLPIGYEEGADVAYCTFMYTLNKEMDTGKFATVSPDIASFVIKTCVELRNEKDFLSSMNTVVNDLRIYTDSFACCVLTVEQDQKMFEIISESVRNNEVCVKEVFSAVPYSVVASWEGLVKETNCIIIKDEHDFEHYKKLAPEWARSLKDNDVHALVLYPLIHHGGIIGYLYITNFDVANILRLQETIELISFFLTAEVANHLFLQRLEYLSNVDMLTGVFNRNCMNVNVDELSLKLEFNPRPFNVAFCDLNGLKTVNDNGGHDRGDKLLVYAADVLKDVFKDDKIFRAGGDEFAIISFSAKSEFEEKINALRERARDPEWLYFAIGYYHDEEDGNLRLAMRYADEEMYKDKDKFYEAYPDKRR
jgi:diguanylate cyclase (GGDEF)-like protein